ncbi:UDP-N-acetylmuramoyl-L-alanyl-D-glutamate--2,6-diaminopimelate ligase, partial [Nocardioides sp.]|uniref:UDP-N-acetylmuramoyl-L-alanyl-D-glutamate--2, 6-diaminopimelate ligase n=1 Tax=Nocardioides sp. TaxID=35761 RepID=UPI003565E5B8
SGAVAVLTDSVGATMVPTGTPVAVVDAPRPLLGSLAAKIYGEPAKDFATIGVTGTQGKTTTTLLAEAGMQRAGITAAAIGTVGTRIAGMEVATALTTPEAPDLHGLFAVMSERRVRACAMEVSSHALRLGRVDGLVFDVALFLNLGRDHLDFHSSLEDYYQAKASLFTPERARRGLVNIDDEHGRRLARESAIPVQTISTHDLAADWSVTDVDLQRDHSTFTVRGPMGGLHLRMGAPMPGQVNVANALAAVAGCAAAGLDAGAVAAGITASDGVPGRFERIEEGQDFTVVVDYAHKPDAVEAALRTLRPLTDHRILVVIGAGGDRDPGKRPMMGKIAAALADVLIVTDDNPRGEDPAQIRQAILRGTNGVRGAQVYEIGDRAEAIQEALRQARPGDIVLIAGKGHETGQQVGATVHPFDDRDVSRRALARLLGGA